MEVNATSQFIGNLLSRGKYLIPDYQREFDWDKEIDEFIEDLNDIENPKDHYFIGHMVFQGDIKDTDFNVIDGQQRITIITILLCAIRDKLYEINETDLANAINEKYIYGKDDKYKSFIRLENKMPYPVLQSYVQSTPDKKNLSIKPIKEGEKKIINAYNKISKLIKNYNQNNLEDLRDRILNLEVIFVGVSGDAVNAQSIFMTLNATGKDLTSVDLIKNQIFILYDKQGYKQPQLNEPHDSWKIILENTKNKTLKFFNNYWASRYNKVKDERLFKEFIKNIVKPNNVNIKTILNNIKDDSILFRKINSPSEDDWVKSNEHNIYLSLKAITQLFSIEVANSFLISIIREYNQKHISLSYLLVCLKKIERFHFINNAICSERSSGLDIMYSKYARELLIKNNRQDRHRILNDLISKLEKKIPSLEKFTSKIDEKLFYSSKEDSQKDIVKYALKKLEIKNFNNKIDILNVSIEHIYPEKAETSNDWSKLSDTKLIKSIGNLVLLEEDINSKIGNKKFDLKKKAIIKDSILKSAKKIFSENTNWGENEILKRRNELINELYINVWK